MKQLLMFLMAVVLVMGCSSRQQSGSVKEEQESRQAKMLLQGIWVDDESGDVAFRVQGDTIFYADSTSMPTYFKIVGDSLVFASGTKYLIEKQTEHLFWFKNQNGDIIKLEKSDEAEDADEFVHDTPKIMTYTHQVKLDSVVTFGGDRYHWYIAINPTKFKVVKRSYNDDGLEVDNVYYDNIMHISVYNGANCLYSSDFRKQQYQGKVPGDFLEGAILGNMEYSHIDAKGLHFNATLCIPDGASCYLVETLISFKGQMTMRLIEY
jgi:hypothetical protein